MMALRLAGLALCVTLLLAPAVCSAQPSMRVAADAAARQLANRYDRETGRWPDVNWWQSANAVTALIGYMQKTGSRAYLPLVKDSFAKNLSYEFGGFRSDSTDDTAWWALALIDMYDLTHDRSYLDLAEDDATYIEAYWDDVCGGGVWWDIGKTYKNAISNELYLKLTASLHNHIPGDTLYLARANRAWQWLQSSGMINAEHLVNDGLHIGKQGCANNDGTTFTYNQGVILDGLTELAIATRDEHLLTTAGDIAKAAVTSANLSPGGILTEPCEAAKACDNDGTSFKGIFVRNLGQLDAALADHPYRGYLAAQAASVLARNRDGDAVYGLHWAGPFDTSGTGRQHSVVDLLTALL